jgi:hypothetical protein
MSFLNEVQLEDKFGPFARFQEAIGFVPNLFRAQTLLPRLVEAQAKLESAVRLQEGAISRVQKERILLRDCRKIKFTILTSCEILRG